MTHDPLCPTLLCNHNDKGECWWGDFECPNPCRCDLIAKVRQDQRIISLSTRVRELKPYANGYCDGERDMLDKCISAVEWSHDHNPEHAQGLWLALTELRALQEKP